MSNNSERMRPIPDGGLKEAMPSWLKRPPAWRELPTVEERHQRSLPEPDTSEIDPHSLVDVNDLPRWLQAIAARGEVPVFAPDDSLTKAEESVLVVSESEQPESKPMEESVTPVESSPAEPAMATTPAEPTVSARSETSHRDFAKPGTPAWILPIVVAVVIVTAIVLYLAM